MSWDTYHGYIYGLCTGWIKLSGTGGKLPCAAHQAFQKPMDKEVASYAYTLYVLTKKLFAGQGEAF